LEKQKNKIIINNPMLKVPCKKVSVRDGIQIGEKLLQILFEYKSGVGLAANQIGINASVCVINVDNKNPIILINPRIIESYDKVVYTEGCLSFPGKSIRTSRYKYCVVKDDLYEGEYYTGSDYNNDKLLECIAIQHEIDHLNGITMFDRALAPKIKYGRNQIITIQKDSVIKQMKWKKAEQLIKSGKWKIKK